MKKIFKIFLVLLSFSASAQQQQEKFSFYVQGGYMSSGYIKESALKEIVSAKETQHHKCIILNAGFLFRISDKWRIGPAFTYDHFGTKHRSVEFSNLSYMIRTDRIWKETKSFSLYSGLSLGIKKVRRFDDEIETARYHRPACQLYLLGVEFRSGHFSIDANAGYGVSGILNIGARYRF